MSSDRDSGRRPSSHLGPAERVLYSLRISWRFWLPYQPPFLCGLCLPESIFRISMPWGPRCRKPHVEIPNGSIFMTCRNRPFWAPAGVSRCCCCCHDNFWFRLPSKLLVVAQWNLVCSFVMVIPWDVFKDFWKFWIFWIFPVFLKKDRIIFDSAYRLNYWSYLNEIWYAASLG